jgi:hypothetical protein
MCRWMDVNKLQYSRATVIKQTHAPIRMVMPKEALRDTKPALRRISGEK